MTLERRNTFTYTLKAPETQSLLALESELTNMKRVAFKGCYGSILGLLHTKVDPTQLNVLLQFFDPAHRCFTFQDFQIFPTLEEFEYLLGVEIEGKACYKRVIPDAHNIAKALHLKVKDVDLLWEMRGKELGLSKRALEAKARQVLKDGNWEAYNALLALLIYGLVMFPSLDNFVSVPALSVFVNGNPAPTLLAVFLYAVYDKNMKGRGRLVVCCTPLIQEWLKLHLLTRGPFAVNRNLKWSERFSALTERDICWYDREREFPKIIRKCGIFPNVPLIGTKGCINYNPVLTLRQLGYPVNVPKNDDLKELVLDDAANDPELWNQIRIAWSQVHREVMGRNDCRANPKYTDWVKERVQMIKMPYTDVVPIERQEAENDGIDSSEKVEALEAMIKDLQEKNSSLSVERDRFREQCSKYQEENDRQATRFKQEQERLEERNLAKEKRWKELQAKEIQIERAKAEAAKEQMMACSQKASRTQNNQKRKYQSDIEKVTERYVEALRIKEAEKREVERAWQEEREEYMEALELQKQISAQLDDSVMKLQNSIDTLHEQYHQNVGKLHGELEALREASKKFFLTNDYRAKAAQNSLVRLVTVFNDFMKKLPKELNDAELGLCVGTADRSVVKFVKKFRTLFEIYRLELEQYKKIII